MVCLKKRSHFREKIIYNSKTLKQIAREFTTMVDKELGKNLATKMINSIVLLMKISKWVSKLI